MKAQKIAQSQTWTDKEIAQLRMGIMGKYLHTLESGYSYHQAIKDAWGWLTDDEVSPFSFAGITLAFGADPETFRRQFCGHLILSDRATRQARELAGWYMAAAPTGRRAA